MSLKQSRFLQLLRIQNKGISTLHFGFLAAILLSLFFSRFMLTVSIIGLAIGLLIGKLYYKTPIWQGKSKRLALKWMLLPAIVTLWYLVSFIYSNDLITAVKTTKVKALFVLIPSILLTLHNITKRQVSYLYHFFLFLVVVGSIWSLIQIPLQKINLTDYYSRGWVIPTVIHHIRFSLMTAFAAIISWFMVFRQPIEHLFKKPIYIALAVFFTVFLHVLAVRSGLIGFYIASIFLVILNLANGKKLLLKSLCIIIALAAIFAAYKSLPTLQSKVNYTLYSFDRLIHTNTDLGDYSDNRRILSYSAAVQVIKENPLFGVGVGDMQHEINKYYKTHYPAANMHGVQPHNQYLLTATGIGLTGMLYLLCFNFLILFFHFRKKNWLLVAFNLIFIFSFLVEDTLEMQIGVTTYLFFNYLGWNFLKEPQETTHEN